MGQRIWVDNEHCKCFVDNIINSAKTIPSPGLDLDAGTLLDSDDEVIDITGQKEYVIYPRLVSIDMKISVVIIDNSK